MHRKSWKSRSNWAAIISSVLVTFTGCQFATQQQPEAPSSVPIPFERFVLPNGLTVIVHEDHDEPAVHVRMFYHVAEKDSGPEERGYPHMFEHLAFSRTGQLEQSIWDFLGAIGASDYDANSQYDYTHFYAMVGVQALDTLLWMESQRMGHLASVLTEEDLARSRTEVFEEEERLLQAPPVRLLKATWDLTYPEGHPYAGFNIASEDLNRATLGDARRFYERYYHPANAVLVIAGDVDGRAVQETVEIHFGSLTAGTPRTRSEARIGRRQGIQRQRIEGVLPDSRLRLVWNTPGWGTRAADRVEILSAIIASRIQEGLEANGLSGEVSSSTEMRELGGQLFVDVATPSPNDFFDVERVVDEEVERLTSIGPYDSELAAAKAEYRRRFEQETADLPGLTHLLGVGELFWGNPGHPSVMLNRIDRAASQEVGEVVEEWLSDGVFILEFVPDGQR